MIWKNILDTYLLFILIYFIIKLFTSDKKLLFIGLSFGLLYVVFYFGNKYDFKVASFIYPYYKFFAPIFVVIVIAPELRRTLELSLQNRGKNKRFAMGGDTTKENIIEATMELSKTKTGALITIEKHNTLEPYAEKAVMLNSNVSKELLINIFTPNTPLHDGAVIIRGDQVLCAGAYFVLTSREDLGKTMGSRHRAGLGISEVTDSFTIVVSEETGTISIAVDGAMLKINDREKLNEYLSIFMR